MSGVFDGVDRDEVNVQREKLFESYLAGSVTFEEYEAGDLALEGLLWRDSEEKFAPLRERWEKERRRKAGLITTPKRNPEDYRVTAINRW